jgi:hypothetical protein
MEAKRPDPSAFIALFPTGFQTNMSQSIPAIQSPAGSVFPKVVSAVANV